jgi:hypothetical protein
LAHSSLRILALIAGCACIAASQPINHPNIQIQYEADSGSWMLPLWDLPMLHIFTWDGFGFGFPEIGEPDFPAAPSAPCNVEPLPPIEDPEAAEFEARAGTSLVVDVEGLTPGMSAALRRFVRSVDAVGGTMELKSAYRPQAYQEHLQAVWDKWMELRNNRDDCCATLKAEVAEEFARHDLIESQRPVASSDHTRGNAFDAAVSLPRRARLKNRRVTLDRLARLCGVMRPAIASDPVHFKLIGARRR